MPRLVARRHDLLLALGTVAGGIAGLLFRLGASPYVTFVGIGLLLVALVCGACGSLRVVSAGRMLAHWDAELLYAALRAARADSIIRIQQTSIPDATKLIGVLEELLTRHDKRFALRILLLDPDIAMPLLNARMLLRVEEPSYHVGEIRGNIDQFIELKERVDAAWKAMNSSAQLELEIRLYRFLPFGSVFQIGEQRVFSGLFWNWTSSINGPMLSISDKHSPTWACFDRQLTEGWNASRTVFPPSADGDGKRRDPASAETTIVLD